MKLKQVWKWAALVAASAAIIAAVSLVGFLSFLLYHSNGGRDWSMPMSEISDTLTRTEDGYAFTGAEKLEPGRWAMLLDEEGRTVWSFRKPEDVPERYSLTEVAAFSRWYLEDYPVLCWVREDGLLVVGSPRGSVWKHDVSMDMEALLRMPAWLLGIFLLALVCVLGLAYLAAGRWFRQAQQVRDAARSGWINGVSHDIRTPLSVVLGYAAQLEAADLPAEQKRQAAAIRAQSQVIRDLVNDLNLTMRLDCEMQALRKEAIQPEAFLRQVGADFLNGGLAEGYDFEMDLPEEPLPELEADPYLLRRALNNLLTNCVRHNAPGCPIRLGARAEGKKLTLWVEGGAAAEGADGPSQPMEPDGGAAHGTGLRLVAQIAAAHGGRAKFYSGTPYRCELVLPGTSRRGLGR